MKAAIYARYSSSGQREESIEGQVRECTEYAERAGFEVVAVYSDKAITGRTDKRPQFQKMISDAEKGLFDVLICWKIDRFARNRYDSAIYKNRLHKNGVSIQYARETISDGAEGIILESVLEGFAEYYSANLSENVKRGNYESIQEHKTFGKKFFGLKEDANGRFTIDEETAPTVRWIFEQYAAGMAIKDIYTTLNRRGIKTTTGGKFDKSYITRMLKNERYTGVYIYAGYRAENAIPAIIPRDLFDACRKRAETALKAPRTREGAPRYILTGKLFCARCGAPMTGESAESAGGKKYYYYTCRNRKTGSCDNRRARKDETETAVIKAVSDCVQDDGFINEIADAVMAQLEEDNAGAILADLKRQEKAKEKEIENFYKAIAAGLNTESAVSFLHGLEDDLQAIRDEIKQETAAAPDITREDVVALLRSYKAAPGDMDGRYIARLFDGFLAAVYLDGDGHGTIFLNTTGTEKKEISFSVFVRLATRDACLANRKRTTAAVFGGFTVIRF